MSTSQATINGKKSVTSRRSWTVAEEQCLIIALKDIVRRGWKCDNGFKTGYLGVLEQAMTQAYPGSNIKADPHINSKIHVWKKNYGSLSTMLSRSGFGWNDSTNTIDVISDQVWNDFVKTDTNARSMRNKSWPFYKDWLEIFGKDRATGEHAEAFVDVVQDLLNNDKVNDSSYNWATHGNDISKGNDSYETDNISMCRGEATLSSKSKDKGKKKRKADTFLETKVVDLMTAFFKKTDENFSELIKCMGVENDIRASRKAVFDALDKLENLTVEDKVNVTRVICDKNKDLDLFFSLNDENKAVMVKMILENRF